MAGWRFVAIGTSTESILLSVPFLDPRRPEICHVVCTAGGRGTGRGNAGKVALCYHLEVAHRLHRIKLWLCGDLSCRSAKEIRVIPRSQMINDSDSCLSACALVLMIGGNRPKVSTLQVGLVLEEFLNLLPEDYNIQRSKPEDFLVEFSMPSIAERILHSHLPPEAQIQLIWRRWHRQSMVSLASLRFRVLIELKGIPAHARNVNTAQTILGTACAELVEAPVQVDKNNNNAILYVAC
uniref:DUF4283 domain-containing protein n=1 Tax=Setaria viridis TaxID=4556 RepID=A0A4U6UQ49_SETVI|nr:hypothetical protein SEVIR_5G310500v2 [Setaria viridis]